MIVILLNVILAKESISDKELAKEVLLEITIAAEAKWKDDSEMVLYEINRQSEAFIRIVRIIRSDKDHGKAMFPIMDKCGFDWAMVEYIYKIKNKAKLK